MEKRRRRKREMEEEAATGRDEEGESAYNLRISLIQSVLGIQYRVYSCARYIVCTARTGHTGSTVVQGT
jgi:hypothetical protein